MTEITEDFFGLVERKAIITNLRPDEATQGLHRLGFYTLMPGFRPIPIPEVSGTVDTVEFTVEDTIAVDGAVMHCVRLKGDKEELTHILADEDGTCVFVNGNQELPLTGEVGVETRELVAVWLQDAERTGMLFPRGRTKPTE